MHEAPCRLAWEAKEFASLLQKDVSRTQKPALSRTSGNSTERGHRAGNNYHRVETGRTADEWYVHVVVGMLEDFWRKAKSHQFVISDLPCVHGHYQMDFMFARVDLFEQTLQINAATGAGRADHNFHR